MSAKPPRLPLKPPTRPAADNVVSMAGAIKKRGPIRGCDIVELPPEPLWPGYLYRGTYTLLSGDAGVGKTSVGCDMIARASRGGPFPTEKHTFTPVRCLILATEDSAGTFRDRLKACDADLTQVDIIRTEQGEDPIALSELHHQLPGYGFVFIETLEAHMPKTVKGNDNMVIRQALQPLLQALEFHKCVGLTVRHWNKVSNQKLIYRSSGAVAYTAASRTALAVTMDGARTRFLSVVKCNLDRERPPLMFGLGSDLRPNWQGYDDDATPGLSAEVADAVELLKRLLKDGRRTAKDVRSEASGASIPLGILNAAKVYLGIKPKRIGFGRGSHFEWALPMQIAEGPPEVPVGDLRTLGEEPGEWPSEG